MKDLHILFGKLKSNGFRNNWKICSITGGTHGIGLSTAITLAKQGCNVAVCSRTSTRIESTLRKLRKENVECIGMQTDVHNSDDIKRLLKVLLKNGERFIY